MKNTNVTLVPVERIENKILLVRGQKVILDRDLAELYNVPTKVFNQAVKRNMQRFPPNFMFKLSGREKDELVTNCDRFNSLKHSSSRPYVFTEHGALMSANVLNSKRAIKMSIMIVDAFVRLRQMALTHRELAIKLKDLENRMDMNDQNVVAIMHALRDHLRQPPPPARKKIGFHTD